jgi:hypothetical protein
MILISKFIFVLIVLITLVTGCTKNETSTQTLSESNESKKSNNDTPSWESLTGQMIICGSENAYSVMQVNKLGTGLLTTASHDNSNFKGNRIFVSSYEMDKNELKINNELYWGVLLTNGKLSNSYSEIELASYRDAIATKTAQVQKFYDNEYIIIPALEQKSIVEKLTLKSASTPDNFIITSHYKPALNVKPKAITCKALPPKAMDSNVANFKSIDTPEKCNQYILNSLDPRLTIDKEMLAEIRENCKKPKQAACLHSKIIETRKTLKDDDLIKMDVIEEWKQQCETE